MSLKKYFKDGNTIEFNEETGTVIKDGKPLTGWDHALLTHGGWWTVDTNGEMWEDVTEDVIEEQVIEEIRPRRKKVIK